MMYVTSLLKGWANKLIKHEDLHITWRDNKNKVQKFNIKTEKMRIDKRRQTCKIIMSTAHAWR